MSDRTRPVPEGFHTVTPYMTVGGAADAIDFYKRAFGATEVLRMADEDGRIVHAEIKIGDSPLMIHDENPEFPGMRGPKSLGGSPMNVFLYVEDVDATMERAVAAGARELMPAEDYPQEGDRRGGVEDPFGFAWWVATHVGDVSREEMQRSHDGLTGREGSA